VPRHLTSDEKLESLKNKYDPSYNPELDEIAPKQKPPEMEKIAKKTAKKPKREPIAKKTAKKPPKIFFKDGVAHDANTGKPL